MTKASELEYRVVESSVVTEDELTRIVNEMIEQGWSFDAFHFVTREGSHRPAMVFAMFKRAGQYTKQEA